MQHNEVVAGGKQTLTGGALVRKLRVRLVDHDHAWARSAQALNIGN